MHRALEFLFATLVSSYTLLFHRYLCKFPSNCSLVHSLVEEICDAFIGDTGSDAETNYNLYIIINEVSLFFDQLVRLHIKLESFKKDMKPIQKNFEAILFFIQATGIIDLHLKLLENLIKHLLARDHLNYARLILLYLATMQNMKPNNSKLWRNSEKRRLCVSKSNIMFTSMEPDHRIEQKNKERKVSGGIIGITQEELPLYLCFLTESVMHTAIHPSLHGNKPKRMQSNVQVFTCVITDGRLCNILTHALVSEQVEEDILTCPGIGQSFFKNFTI